MELLSSSQQVLSADDILGADDTVYELVHVPEWRSKSGVEHVRVKSMSGVERDAFEASIIQQVPAIGGPRGAQPSSRVNMTNLRAKLVARSIVGNDGARLFTDEQVEALGKKSASALARVYDAAAKLSRVSDEDAKELAGNSEATTSAD